MRNLHRAVLTALVATLFLALPTTSTGATTTSAATSTSTTDQAGGTTRDPTIQTAMDRLVSRHDFPGAIAVVRDSDGKVRTYRAGTNDLRTGEPIARNARVRIASNTKMFTATVVLQLVAEQRIDLDATIETYLPHLVRGQGNDGRTITVRNLLQQTSGLPDYDNLVIDAGGTLRSVAGTYYEPHQLLDAASRRSASSRPGPSGSTATPTTSSSGCSPSRSPDAPSVRRSSTASSNRPACTTPTGPRSARRTSGDPTPRGYLADEPGGRWHDLTRTDPSLGWAAGQLISTPRDLGRFMQALLDGDLLPAAQLAQMKDTVKAPRFDAEPGWRYGLGLANHRLDCGVTGWGHGGDIQGYETRNLITEDGRWAVVAVTALPTSLPMVADVSQAVETAICTS